MKSLAVISIFALFAGVTSTALGQSHAVGLSQPDPYATSSTGIGTNSKNATGAAKANATPTENSVDGDDTLYRGSTQETENPMMRDEGPLHLKRHPREKAQEVDSKQLHTSGTDPKFQGNLLHSSVTSIEDVSDKAAAESKQAASKDQGDPRFRTRQLVFTPQADDESNKKEKKAGIKADSSPSPSPSPSASASPAQSKR